MSEITSVTITSEEKTQLLEFFSKLDVEMLQNVAEAISMMVRAFEGRSIEKGDIVTRLVNVKNILERSNFPTYPLMAKNVYLRLLHKYGGDEAEPYGRWADLEATALTSYKHLSRDNYVEMTKGVTMSPEQQFIFDRQTVSPQEQPKKRFWHRKPKETSEFQEQ